MPRSWLCLLACLTGLLVGFRAPDDGPPAIGPGAGAADAEDVELAGLPEGTRAEVLTWDRAYKLAVVRARSEPGKEGRRAATLDPKRLDEEARRVGFGDFGRFRREFLAGVGTGPRGFRDPAPAVQDVARRARAASDAMRHVRAHERRFREATELVKNADSGRTQLGVDQLDGALQTTRVAMLGQVRRYRDGLDALKVELGLAPEAPIVIDPAILAAFGRTFEAAEAWLGGPAGKLSLLDGIVNGAPEVDDLAIGGLSMLKEFQRPTLRTEDLLQFATRAAIANRGDRRSGEDDELLTLRVRREVRLLNETYLDSRIEARRFVLRLREADQARGSFDAQPAIGPAAEPIALAGLADALSRLDRTEDRLVAHWVAYQAQRIALLRDLGTLPADGWPAFLAPLYARNALWPR